MEPQVDQRTRGTVTEVEMKARMTTKNMTVAKERLKTKNSQTTALTLPFGMFLAPGIPLLTPEIEQRVISKKASKVTKLNKKLYFQL